MGQTEDLQWRPLQKLEKESYHFTDKLESGDQVVVTAKDDGRFNPAHWQVHKKC